MRDTAVDMTGKRVRWDRLRAGGNAHRRGYHQDMLSLGIGDWWLVIRLE
jgi:hypothetical protein